MATSQPFAVKINLIARVGSKNFTLGYSNDDYTLYDWNGNYKDMSMSTGDSMEIMIICDGSSTWAQIINNQE